MYRVGRRSKMMLCLAALVGLTSILQAETSLVSPQVRPLSRQLVYQALVDTKK